jgi:hypothetical protein
MTTTAFFWMQQLDNQSEAANTHGVPTFIDAIVGSSSAMFASKIHPGMEARRAAVSKDQRCRSKQLLCRVDAGLQLLCRLSYAHVERESA